jgi:hypothetical protein
VLFLNPLRTAAGQRLPVFFVEDAEKFGGIHAVSFIQLSGR